jgi:hypothetical protein
MDDEKSAAQLQVDALIQSNPVIADTLAAIGQNGAAAADTTQEPRHNLAEEVQAPPAESIGNER